MEKRRTVGRARVVGVVGVVVVVVGAVGLLAGAPRAAAQQREHCGEVTSNETWTQPSSPHLVNCDVVVRNSTLTIAPGAQVLMGAGTNLVLGTGARLRAVGVEADGITILPNARDETAGFWGQIRFEPDALPSEMDYVTVIGGGKDKAPMIESRGTVVAMNHIRLQLAQDVPLALTANEIGPSLEGPGAGSAQGSQCTLLRLVSNGATFIRVLADADRDVTDSQLWHDFCAPYRLDETLTIGGPDSPALSLNPGVALKFNGDAGLVAGAGAENPGQVEANGNPTQPVVFSSETQTPGAWTGIDLTQHGAGSSFINARIEYGGRGDRPMLVVRQASTVAVDLSLRHAAGYPLAIRADVLGDFSTGLVQSSGQRFVGNAIQRVLVLADEVSPDLAVGAEWGDIGAPYEVQGDLTIAGRGRRAELALLAGTRLIFDGTEALVLGDPSGDRGALSIEGTASRPVVLTAASGQAGGWTGVRVTEAADTVEIEGAVIEHGGAGGAPMVDWADVPGLVTRSTLRGAAGYPISLPLHRAGAVMGEPFRDGSLRNRYEGNGTDRILLRAGAPLTDRLITWADPGAPAEVDGSVVVGASGRPVLELYDGLTLLFRPGGGLQFGLGGQARVTVRVHDEDSEVPVTFGPVDEAVGWAGARLLAGSTLRADDLRVVGVADDAAAIGIEGAQATAELTAVVLEGRSRGVGLDVADGSTAHVVASRIGGHRVGVRTRTGGLVDVSRSFVTGNTQWGVQNEDPRTCQVANLVFWGSQNGPNDPSDAEDGCMNAGNASPLGDRVSDDVDWWPYALDAEFTPSAGLGPNPKQVFLPSAQKR